MKILLHLKYFYFVSLLILSGTLACTQKQQSLNTLIDQAKLEQIKSILSEQETSVDSSAPEPKPVVVDNSAEQIIRIEVRPQSLELLEGKQTDFRVVAIRRDSREITLSSGVDITSSNPDLLTIEDDPDSARYDLRAKNLGIGKLNVFYKTLQTEVTVRVMAKEILGLEIIPKFILLGSPARFSLVASYDNGDQLPIEDGVEWQSSDPLTISQAPIPNPSNIFTGRTVGIYGVRATYMGSVIVSRTKVQMPILTAINIVNSDSSVMVGSSTQLKAQGLFVNGDTFDISSSVEWSIDATEDASITPQGVLEGLNPGEVIVRARFGKIEGVAKIYINNAAYVRYSIEPSSLDIPLGLVGSAKIFGILADGVKEEISSSVNWQVADQTILQSGGLSEPFVKGSFGAIQKGTTQVKIRYGLLQWVIPVTVTDAVPTALLVSSEDSTGPCGIYKPHFKAEGTFSDGSKRDMTEEVLWTVEPATLGVVSNELGSKGFVVTTAPGLGTVRATFGTSPSLAIVGQKAIEVGAAEKIGLAIKAPVASLALGETLRLIVRDELSCGVGLDQTQNVVWSSNNTDVASVSNITATKGLLSTKGTVNATMKFSVTASKDTWTGELELELRPKEVKSISIRANTNELVVGGETTGFSVEAKFSDDTIQDISPPNVLAGHSLSFVLGKCNSLIDSQNCAIVNAATGELTSQSIEGIARPSATLVLPDGSTVSSSNKISVRIMSKCLNGTRSGLYCLSLGSKGQSCSQTCAANGASYHEASSHTLGFSGDSYNCSQGLKVLGYVKGLESLAFKHPQALGCAIYDISTLKIQQGVRESTQDPTDVAAHADFQRVCACREP